MSTVRQYREIQERLRRLQAATQIETDSRARARLFSAIGGCYQFLGEPEQALQSFRMALKEDPEHPERAEMQSHIALFEDPNRRTPWDTESAVAPYDDAEEIEAHRHLPYEELLRSTARGHIRKSILDTVFTLHRPGMRILEAGCATASYYGILRLFTDVRMYCGVDLTPLMLAKARSNYPEAEFLRMDIRRLGFCSDGFEIVFSTDVTMHLVEWREALAELYRVTKHYLILRMRLLIDDRHPTLVARLGAGRFEVPYVIHNWPDLAGELRLLTPPLEEIRVISDQAESMYGHLWQIYREHPQLPVVERDGQIGINRRFDVLLVKQTAREG